jgi:pimeloyl-ACP methyl ester carboxylesterase
MRCIKFLTGLAIVSFATACLAQVDNKHNTKQNTIHNTKTGEQVITFTSKSGQTTQAFQGRFNVPENRLDDQSRQIAISYVRFPATGSKKGPPIIYLAGGPGGSGIATAKGGRFPLFMALRQFGDVIALDQRGTGQSESASACQSSQQLSLTKAYSSNDIAEHYRKAALECVTQWQQQGFDVNGYTTVQNAWDIDDLRQHLGADKITLWGISYGSHLALAAMELFEERIEKVIIASAEGLNQTVKLPSRTDRYFERLQQTIDAKAELKQRYPDLKALMARVHRSLEQQPLLVDIPAKDGSVSSMLFQKSHMQMLASMMIADPSSYLGMLLQLYATLDSGSKDMLVQVLQYGMFDNKAISFRLMPMAMDIASGISESRLKTVNKQAETSLLGLWLNFPMPQLNGIVPGLDLGDAFRQPKPRQVPTLLLSGTLDGRTYPQGQVEATRHLKNLTQVTVINAGHNLFTVSPEVLKVMEQFLANKSVDKASIILEPPSF